MTEEIYAGRTFLPWLKERVERLANMHHWRLAAFTGKSIHIAGTNREPDSILSRTTDSLHVRSKQSIHAGNAYHDYRRLCTCSGFIFTDYSLHGSRNLL